jgi:hypothetical protein
MAPIVRNVQTQQVDEQCPSCGKGFMRPTGVVKTTTPPQYEHSCTACGYKNSYSTRYPFLVS